MLPPKKISALLQGTIDALEESIAIITPKYEVLFLNRGAEKRFNKSCEEAIGKRCFLELGGLSAPCAHCALRRVVETGVLQQVEFTSIDEESQRREYEQYHYPLNDQGGNLLAVVEITRDITERRMFERQLLHSEKLAALGQLSTSIAHEIRNPLTGIRLGMDALLDQAEDEQRETLEAIVKDVRRLDQVLTQLLDFTRRKEPQRHQVSVPELIERALFFIRKQAQNQKVEVKLNLRRDLPDVEANSDQLLQVFLNIFLNALQAMPEGGMLRIRADRLTHSDTSGVLITVQDTGKGFPKEHRERLFEMFFSTKPTGSGVGLAVSNKIIAEHGGAIWVESPPGMGALVNIFLPLRSDREAP